ncbi:MAG: hypothetical protein AAF564_06235 [Bacteroidota bacterium]
MSTNYEWVTAHTLVTLQIWQEEGMFAHGMRPIYTFSNPNDHYIKCPISGISDDTGNYYYVSYPPFAFIFPHVIFNTLGIDPDVLSLESLNLLLHFLCAVMLYLLIGNLLPADSNRRAISIPALIAAAIYIFSPLPLWHHANVYFADILVQLFFIIGLYLSHRLLFAPGNQSDRRLSALLFLTLFLMAYTEWIGFLFGICLAALALLFRKHVRHGVRVIWISFFALLFSGLLTFFQYSTISGITDFIDIVLNRYTERSGHLGKNEFYQLNAHLYLSKVYLRNYFPQFVIIGFLGLMMWIVKPLKVRLSTEEKVFLLLALLPALLHHVVLFEFTLVHDMALVKTCVFISLLSGILLYRVQSAKISQEGIAFKIVPHFVIVSMLAFSAFLYHAHVIEPDGFSFKALGEEIRANAGPDDTVFFKTTRTLGDFLIQAPENFVIAPQIQYYSGRCIQVVPDAASARVHLQKYNKPQGVIFTIENNRYQIEQMERIAIDSP